MRKYLIGFAAGVAVALVAPAIAAEVVGNGYLDYWRVTKDGVEICTDPYVYGRAKEIECG